MFFILDLAQSNSEHCRHHFFNGKIILDNEKMKYSLFELVKKPLNEKKKRRNPSSHNVCPSRCFAISWLASASYVASGHSTHACATLQAMNSADPYHFDTLHAPLPLPLLEHVVTGKHDITQVCVCVVCGLVLVLPTGRSRLRSGGKRVPVQSTACVISCGSTAPK